VPGAGQQRRHRLWEHFLKEKLGFSDTLHKEACRLEHTASV
jgi:Mn-dependent DtxR family transcriptional regulator